MSVSPIAVLRAAAPGLVLLALLTGLPWLFLHTWASGVITWPDTVTWPHFNTDLAAAPRHNQVADWVFETYHDLRTGLGFDGALVLLFLAAGWVGWAGLVAAVLTDLLRLTRHGAFSVRARVDTSPRGLITAAVCSTVLLGSASSAMAAAPAEPPPAATAPQDPGPAEYPASTEDEPSAAEGALTEPPVYTTFRGDTLWDLADRYLHDPHRWPEIAALNPGLDDTGLLQPGQHLRMPEPCWLVDPLPASERSHTVTVQRGETLSDIAARELGDAGRWGELFDLNTHHRQPDARTLLDPDFLFPGWQITIPPQATDPAPQPDDGAVEPGQESAPMWTFANPLRAGVSSPPLGESVEVDRNAVRGIELRDGTVLGAAACASVLAVLFVAGRRVHRITARRATTRERAPSITHAVDIAEYLPLSNAAVVDIPQAVDLGGGGLPTGDGGSFELSEDAGSDVSPSEPARPAGGERFLLDLGATDEELVGVDLAAAGGLGVTGPAAGHVVRSLVGQALARHGRERVLLHTSAFDALAEPGGSWAAVDDDTLPADTAHPLRLVVVDAQHLRDMMRRWLTENPAGVVVLALGDWPTGLTLSTDGRGVITAVVPHHDGFEGLHVFTDSDQDSSGGVDSPPVSGHTVRDDLNAETLDSAESPGRSSSDRVCDRAGQEQAALVVQLLGAVQFAVRDSDGARRDITDKLSPRLRELLVYLAVHPDGVARETLVDDVWQDSPPARPTNALNTAVSRLRTSLAQAAEVNVEDILGGSKRELRLVAEHVDVDYWHFVRADHRTRGTSGEQQVAAWEAVVDLYAGPLAPEISSLWIHAARQAVQSAAVNAVAGLARQHAQEDPQRALQLVEFGTHIDPLNEHLYRDIMRLQSRLGHAEALPHTLALLRTRLQEAGMEPSSEIEKLARKLRDRHTVTEP